MGYNHSAMRRRDRNLIGCLDDALWRISSLDYRCREFHVSATRCRDSNLIGLFNITNDCKDVNDWFAFLQPKGAISCSTMRSRSSTTRSGKHILGNA